VTSHAKNIKSKPFGGLENQVYKSSLWEGWYPERLELCSSIA